MNSNVEITNRIMILVLRGLWWFVAASKIQQIAREVEEWVILHRKFV